MITSLMAENFKSWAKTGPVSFASFTGIFGSNSSGKTSLLQLLLMMKQTIESTDRGQVLNLGDDRSLVELGTFKDLIFKHTPETQFHFGLTWKLKNKLKVANPEKKNEVLLEDNRIGFSTHIEDIGSWKMSVTKFTYFFAKYKFGMRRKAKGKNQYSLHSEINQKDDKSESVSNFNFKRTPGRVWDLPTPVKCYGFPDQVKGYYQNASFLADLELSLEDIFRQVYYLGPLREYPKRQYTWAGAQPADMGRKGEKVVDALLASRDSGEKISRGRGQTRFTVEEYVAYWLKELGLIETFSVEPIAEGSNLYQVWVQKSKNSAKVLITDVGFGVSQILPVLTLCYYVPEGSTILMEQPEIHLHPAVQAGLADVFLDAIKFRNVQIIIESHSEHLLRRLRLRVAQEKVKSSEAMLYFCEMNDGRSKLCPLEMDMFGNILNWPEGFFGDEFGEMAAMNRAIIDRKKREFK